ncbi:MAG TPA: RNA polymerase sigma factor region1.1 domain-containing protein, partial [Gammaproteobacteria bacterium]|nr:RNA polymerase sigma factor region1.1 domain-containing protein [Gammaproteobacteria bacterium]
MNQKTDDRQSQLKLLIAKGKEQGYLTYAEVNDHLPNEIVDPEQIEEIIAMINDMGIPVHEEAPDAEQLLLAENTVTGDDDEDAAEEAAAALALDAEFGRTTDPVRMYMREMGTVELLTREGEIKIAKRIEEGLNQVLGSVATYPATTALLLSEYAGIAEGRTKLTDIIAGFIDPNADLQMAQTASNEVTADGEAVAEAEADEEGELEVPAAAAAKGKGAKAAAKGGNEEEEEGGDGEAENPADTGPDPEEAARHFKALGKLHDKVVKSLTKNGSQHKTTIRLRKQLAEEMMTLKLTPRMTDTLTGNLRRLVENIRGTERQIMFLCVQKAGMPRKDFIKSFPDNETNT